MSALPPKVDISRAHRNVRQVPIAEVVSRIDNSAFELVALLGCSAEGAPDYEAPTRFIRIGLAPNAMAASLQLMIPVWPAAGSGGDQALGAVGSVISGGPAWRSRFCLMSQR
jgi:hypothetical protein